MLQSVEPNLKKEKGQLLVVESSGTRKKRPKKKKAQKAKSINPKKGIKKDKVPKEKCHFYGKDRHWKRNYRAYITSLKKEKPNEASTSGTFMIEMLSSINSYSTWVLVNRCGSHICNI